MADGYRIIGAEMSPYSVKVRSYFRYKAIPHQWVLRNAASQAEFEKYAKMPIIPLVVTPEGTGIQEFHADHRCDRKAPSRAVDPSRRSRRALHFRTDRGIRRRVGQQMDVSLPLGARCRPDQFGRAPRAHARPRSRRGGKHAAFTAKVRARMVDRVWFVGSNAVTAPQIEAGFLEMLALLDKHLATRPYLFGGTARIRRFRPVGADLRDVDRPDRGALIGGGAPHVLDWVHRMLWPKAEGAFERGRRWNRP